MNITAAANTCSENATGSTRIVPSEAEGMALCTGFIFELAFIIVGNLLTIVLFAVTGEFEREVCFW